MTESQAAGIERKIETFCFFRLRFRRAYDSSYVSDFRLSLGRKRSYLTACNTISNSVAVKTNLRTDMFPTRRENLLSKIILPSKHSSRDGDSESSSMSYVAMMPVLKISKTIICKSKNSKGMNKLKDDDTIHKCNLQVLFGKEVLV